MKLVLLFASISLASGLLFVNLYTSIVDARSWGVDLPSSIATARDYFKHVNPGDFFRVFSPLNQVLALIALVASWKVSATVRGYLAGAFVLYVISEVLTFAFFYPRNEVMFNSGALTDTALLRETWSQWSSVNWVRSFLLAAGLVLAFVALHKTYIQREAGRAVAARTAGARTSVVANRPAQAVNESL